MTRGDLIVILLLSATVGWAAAAWWQPAGGAPTSVEVRSGDGEVGVHRLGESRELRVPGRIGDSVIRFEGARARFVDGPCRNKVCIHRGWLSRSGEAAACVPNGVSLRLVGGEAEFDDFAH